MTTYPNSSSVNSQTANWWDGGLVFWLVGLPMVIYGRTLTPGLLFGDGGEFQALTYLWGHSHPTGYPVYLTLAHVFAWLPTGDLAFRVNLFSMMMALLTVVGVYVCARLLTDNRLICAAAALAFAVSATFWSQAIIAEVYSAGAAFFIWILVALLYWQNTGSQTALLLAGLLGGLSLGVHLSVALLAPAAILFLFLSKPTLSVEKGWQTWRERWQRPLLGAMLGVAIVIVLFWLMDRHNPAASYFNSVIEPSRSAWGLAAEDIDSFGERLLWGWRAQQFRSFMWQSAVLPQNAAAYWQNLPQEFPWLLLLAVPVGLVALLWRRWQTAVLLIVALGIQLFCFFQYDIWDLYVFYIPSYLILILLAIAGMGTLTDMVVALIDRQTQPEFAPKGRFVVEVIFALLLIGTTWLSIQPRITAVVERENPFDFAEYPEYIESADEFLRRIVSGLPANAILFTNWDTLYAFYYVAYVQQERTDLLFIETLPADDQEVVADSLLAFVQTNVDDRPIYFSDRVPQIVEAGFSLSPMRVGHVPIYKVQNE